jgi:putative two-component system response regulator
MEHLAQQSGQKQWIRKSKCFCGICLSDSGDVQGGMAKYREALGIARELGDIVAESTVVLNLGAALFYAGLYTEAMKCYEHTCALAGQHPQLDAIASSACSNMAQVCLRQEKYELGLQHIRRAMCFRYDALSPHYNLHCVILARVHVELALGIGDRQLADEHLAICEEYARRAQTRRTQFEATMARGLCEIDHGIAQRGLEALKRALDSATLDHERILCITQLIGAHEQSGDVEQALCYVDELCATATRLYQSGIKGLTGEDGLCAPTARHDELDSWVRKRSRLQALAAEKQAIQSRTELIERLALTAQFRDQGSGLHGHRVGCLAALLARSLGFKSDLTANIQASGRLHDIGKIGVPEKVLLGGKATSQVDRQLLQTHVSIGADLLAGSAIRELRCAEIVARHHHERWDGRGYPSGLIGKRIPVECRIVALADAFDAMTHGRPQVKPLSINVALAEIELEKGRQFDPDLADAFCALVRHLVAEHTDLGAYLEETGQTATVVDALASVRDVMADLPGDKRRAGNALRNGDIRASSACSTSQ